MASSFYFTAFILSIVIQLSVESTLSAAHDTMEIRAILFDMDGTLLDTESLSDKAVLLAFGPALPEGVLQQQPMNEFRLPWELKKRMLGLRGAEWTPIALQYAKDHWGVTDDRSPPSP